MKKCAEAGWLPGVVGPSPFYRISEFHLYFQCI
jgi:hypothetical protein